jgi:hypothetical protein
MRSPSDKRAEAELTELGALDDGARIALSGLDEVTLRPNIVQVFTLGVVGSRNPISIGC